jgi:hypothetical protein
MILFCLLVQLFYMTSKRIMAKYSKKSQEKVCDSMRELKKDTLKSGSGKKVKSRKQAIAIGLSEARKEGVKVPKKASANKASPKKKASAEKWN